MEHQTASYPGALASPQQILALAEAYHQAANRVLQIGQSGKPLTRAPFRLLAIHAIELYLNAFLLHRGHAPNEIRGLQHNLDMRAALAQAEGLKLRDRTALHLRSLNESREYLVTRYGPELAGSVSQVNRLTATLEEVAGRVTKLLAQPSVPVVRKVASTGQRAASHAAR